MRYAHTRHPLSPHPSGARLVDSAVSPWALVEAGGSLRLNGTYYITKQIIPALERVLSLVRGGRARVSGCGCSLPVAE